MTSIVPWLLLASLASFGCAPERDPPSYSSSFGETIDGHQETRHFEGDALDPDLTWSGYRPGSEELGTISLDDYYDPDGKKHISALLIVAVSATCPACQQTASEQPERLAGGWTDLGIEVIHLVMLDSNNAVASAEAAFSWKTNYGASWAVGFDPNFTFVNEGHNALPIQVLVNPRTLQMVGRIEGYRSSYPDLMDLASVNQ